MTFPDPLVEVWGPSHTACLANKREAFPFESPFLELLRLSDFQLWGRDGFSFWVGASPPPKRGLHPPESSKAPWNGPGVSEHLRTQDALQMVIGDRALGIWYGTSNMGLG